ncbi:MAG: hypothetical protein NTX64_09360 [Elusimicrobia bacterium]|nr:hypothetical protein [Elusimicrobiota bacterium]
MKSTNGAFVVTLMLAALLPIECRAVAGPGAFGSASKCPGQYDCNGNGTECAKSKDCCSRNVAQAAARCKAMGCTCDSCGGSHDCGGNPFSDQKLRDALGSDNGLQGDPGTDGSAGNDADKLGDPTSQHRNSFTVENDNDSRGNASGDSSHQGVTASNLHSDLVDGVVIDPKSPNGVRLGDYGVITDNATGQQYPVVAYDAHGGRGNAVSEISNGLQQAMTGVDNSNRSVSGDYTVEMYPGSGKVFNDGQNVRRLGDDQVNANMGRFYRAYLGGKN